MKYFRISVITVLLGFLSIPVFSQKNITLSGTVINYKTKEEIPDAGVAICNAADSSQVKGTSANINGTFTLSQIDKGKYFLVVGAVGFEKFIGSAFEISAEQTKIDIGTIELHSKIIELKGLEVVEKKQFIEQEAGKIIVNPESDPAGTGDNVLELLKKVPGITVENDETIKLNGKTGILILMDGKKTYLSGDALIMMLKNTPTSGVDKIEVITSPSEKYDAEGVSGILNIKTKRNNNIGVNGSVYANAGYSELFKHSEGLDLSLRLKKWTMYGNIGNNSYPSKYDYYTILSYPNGTSFETNTGEGESWASKNSYQGQNYKLGADYYLDDRNIIGFVWRMSSSGSNSENNSFTRIMQNGITDSSYNALHANDNDFNYNVFNFNYKRIFDSAGTELNIDFDYSHNSNPSEADNTTVYYAGDFTTLTRNELTEYNNQYKANIYSAKADFEHPFSKKLNFTAGAKVSYVVNDNSKDGFNNGVLDFERTNHFTYNENISALYSGLNINFSQQTSLRLGLRGEYTYTKGKLESPDSTSSHSYFDLFPNLTFRQQVGKNNSFDFAYRYRIQRPGYTSLNPFLYRNSQYSYSQGNPDLKPQYSHSLVLSYSFMNMVFLSADYAHSEDQSRYLNYFDPTTFVSISRPQNIGTNNSLWFSLSGSIPITKWWHFSFYGGCGWSNSEINYVDSLVRTNSFNSSIWVGQYFTITKNLTAELSGWGQPSATDDDFSSYRGIFSINAGLRHTFFDQKLSVRLSMNDIFNTAGVWKSEYSYPTGITQKSESKWGSRSVWLSLNFQFGKQNIQIRQRKTASEEEQGRTGGSGSATGGEAGKK